MKYIYILYSNSLAEAYIGSTSLKLKRRLCFHHNDNRRNYGLTCSNILRQNDCCIDIILSFDDISKTNLEMLEAQLIKQYKNSFFIFKNNIYKIVNKIIPYNQSRSLCSCGCNKELVISSIRKHLKNKNKNSLQNNLK